MLFSQRHYHVHTVFWCFFAMIGLTAILKILIRFYPDRKNTLFLSVFLLPTVLFWGSGVLKEALLLMGLGLFLLGFFRYILRESYTSDIVNHVHWFFHFAYCKRLCFAMHGSCHFWTTSHPMDSKKEFLAPFQLAPFGHRFAHFHRAAYYGWIENIRTHVAQANCILQCSRNCRFWFNHRIAKNQSAV